MAPAKKATPKLADLLNKDDGNHPETEVETPPPSVDSGDEVVVTQPDENSDEDFVEPVFVEDSGVYANVNVNNDKQGFVADANSDHVHKWQENHDHNLATLHPDVTRVDVPHPAAVSTDVTVLEFANPADIDDKGIVGPPEEQADDVNEDENVEG